MSDASLSAQSGSTHPAANPRLVSLTEGQIEHILELVSWGDRLDWGRNRRAAIKAKMLAALEAKPTPVFPEEPDDA